MNDTFELYPLPPAALESLRASASSDGCPEGVAIVHGLPEENRALLSPEILTLVRDLVRKERTFEPNLEGLMAIRRQKQSQIYMNLLEKKQAMSFPAETKEIRDGSWRSETDRPSNMRIRACENTHPSRAANMAIHGLNSAAASDFLDNEDSQAPLKANVLSGYHVIKAAVDGTLMDDRPNSKTILKGRLSSKDLLPFANNDESLAQQTFAELKRQGVLNGNGRVTDILTRDDFVLDADNKLDATVKKDELEAFLRSRRPATIQVRMRGLHLLEGHFLVDGQPISAGLLDFAVFVATCHKDLAEIHAQPTLYLPKMEGRFETEWWAKLFQAYAAMLGIDPKVIRSTTMIETITASMEKDEMNYTLRQHSLGQNKGRYDYLFNFIKRLTLPKSQQVVLLRKAVESADKGLAESYRQFVLPDNQHTPMGTSFLEAYSNHTSQINLKRGFDSVGGMVTNIPTGNPEVDGKAHAKLRVDKTNEAWKGDSGGWSGHPAFSPYVREPFDIVRGIHEGFRLLASQGSRASLISAIQAISTPGGSASTNADEMLAPLLAFIATAAPSLSGKRDKAVVDNLVVCLKKSATLHVAQDLPAYKDGLVRFIAFEAPQPDVKDIELITVPPEQHSPGKFTYAGLKSYLRLALYYTASFIHGTGCIALDGVFEDLATAEKARCNVWQWLSLDQSLIMPDGSSAVVDAKLLNQAFDEVYDLVTGPEREMWGRVCKSVTPMQPDSLDEKHFRVARRVLDILMTNDRCIEFIPDLAYPFLLEPVRQSDDLWEQLYQNLETYRDPMGKHDAEIAQLRAKLA